VNAPSEIVRGGVRLFRAERVRDGSGNGRHTPPGSRSPTIRIGRSVAPGYRKRRCPMLRPAFLPMAARAVRRPFRGPFLVLSRIFATVRSLSNRRARLSYAGGSRERNGTESLGTARR
jgi:hypothetical protein